MIPPIASRIPLVRRPKAPVLPLDERIRHLSGLTVKPAVADHHDLVARASGVLNYAALIASDLDLPDLATELCWRQHQAFTQAGALSGDIAVMALMPLVNLSRLLTREGDGEGAYDVLERLYQAARLRGTAHIRGHDIDLPALLRSDSDHRKVCQELWSALLVDGARALARIGRWTQAADIMAAHRGIGDRLLDGRQILIMSLMERGLDEQAREVIDTSAPTEPWENAIAALLRLHCRTPRCPAPDGDVEAALREATTAVSSPEPATAVFQTRVGLVALDLAGAATGPRTEHLRDAVVNAAALDASAAREVLGHRVADGHLSEGQVQRLSTVLAASGIGARAFPQVHVPAFTRAVDLAEAALGRLL